MNIDIIHQSYLFGIYLICGIFIGILFDLFRILRRSFKTPDTITYIQDIIFGILTGIFLIFVLFIFNNGELRFYIFLALITGLILYLSTISKLFIKISVKFITAIKKIIIKIFSVLFYPIKLIKNVMARKILNPFRILTINVKNILKNKKISKNEKDFSK